ncbi:M3 family oligoendopeptidase [Gorillibacterium sp. sgz5001074]|uniref:M3 family oligoendopeptidase n=1 Tax=Gorillibacterium sp. sgz5001074 TaxID=3446695 RepID=UPI003F6730F7
MKFPLSQTWDLDAVFPGGSSSEAFTAFLEETEVWIGELTGLLADEGPVADAGTAGEKLAAVVERMQRILARVREAEAFTGCLAADNMADKRALQLEGKVKTLAAAYQTALTRMDRLLISIPSDVWSQVLSAPVWKEIAFNLEERRTAAQERMAPELEALAGDLAVDGYHGWSSLYDTAVSHFRLPFEEDGKTVELSAGQAHNKLHSGNRSVRVELFRRWEEAWAGKADFCADALNRIGGFRLQLYKHRGWQSIHKEPLDINRMRPETLEAMWSTIERNKAPLVRYLERKAKLLGVDRLAWHDVDAPLGENAKHISYDEGAGMIVEQFRRFSPKMAEFAEMAFEKRWIEAEDRTGKRPGGFCSSFPVSGQTRIFMTYGGTSSNVSTLAHELGHAYHQHVMNDLPPLNQEYAMNVAETASTFAEMIVSDAALRLAENPADKLAMLDDKLQRAVAFMMNIHARFIFETNFYEERRKGLVGTDRLCSLMEDAQRQAYKGVLGEYHPHFWASKMHFYLTDVPFYNFPYTFGFLFSSGIYAQAEKEGAGFEDRYVGLLRDTGRMQVEELAKLHLGVDLTGHEFWQSAIDLSLRDAELFLKMTE